LFKPIGHISLTSHNPIALNLSPALLILSHNILLRLPQESNRRINIPIRKLSVAKVLQRQLNQQHRSLPSFTRING
jgi:hypothetical protein